MTIKKLIEKYTDLQKKGYETITLSQVVNDLWQMKRQNDLRRIGRPK